MLHRLTRNRDNGHTYSLKIHHVGIFADANRGFKVMITSTEPFNITHYRVSEPLMLNTEHLNEIRQDVKKIVRVETQSDENYGKIIAVFEASIPLTGEVQPTECIAKIAKDFTNAFKPEDENVRVFEKVVASINLYIQKLSLERCKKIFFPNVED